MMMMMMMMTTINSRLPFMKDDGGDHATGDSGGDDGYDYSDGGDDVGDDHGDCADDDRYLHRQYQKAAWQAQSQKLAPCLLASAIV